jgi:hypothetical protein
VGVPGDLHHFRGRQLARGQVELLVTNDNSLSNDYIRLRGSLELLGVSLALAYTSYFDGRIVSQSDLVKKGKELEKVNSGTSGSQVGFFQVGKMLEEANTYLVEPSSEWILLTSSWENKSDKTPDFIIKRPDGPLRRVWTTAQREMAPKTGT